MKELSREYVLGLLPERRADSNKATYGSVLNVAGSANYRGAACLSSLSALRVGAGYATLACPAIIAGGVASYDPDIITVPLRASSGCIARGEWRTIARILWRYSAVSIGCGLSSLLRGTKPVLPFFRKTLECLRSLDIPIIIDADGLNMISSMGTLELPARTILTPHPKELSRLLCVDTSAIQADRIRWAEEAAHKFHATVVLKGYRTVIAGEGGIWVNTTGGPALAKAGTGDVLTGMIAGFCAQGLSPENAACLGVYLHGKAGDLAAAECSEYGVLASDVLNFVPYAIGSLRD